MFVMRRCSELVFKSSTLQRKCFSMAICSRRTYRSVYDPAELHKHPVLKGEADYTVPKSVDANRFNGFIPLDKLQVSYSLASGPGGQNVNKNPTRAEVRFHVMSAEWIPSNIREKFFEKYAYRICKDGYFIVRSERTRSQDFNLADCMDKIRFSVRECEQELKSESKTPTEEELEKIKIRQIYADRRRLEQKRQDSRKKQDLLFS